MSLLWSFFGIVKVVAIALVNNVVGVFIVVNIVVVVVSVEAVVSVVNVSVSIVVSVSVSIVVSVAAVVGVVVSTIIPSQEIYIFVSNYAEVFRNYTGAGRVTSLGSHAATNSLYLSSGHQTNSDDFIEN